MALKYDIDAGMCSEAAARKILGKLLEEVVANEDGVRRQLDIEHLHDFRVAVRRARTLLPELKRVLPAEACKPFRAELAWLGKLTNVARDLDVHLELLARMPAERQQTLEPFLRLLRDKRKLEQQRLLAGLDSPRYAALIASWHRLSNEEVASGPRAPRAGRPVQKLATKRIRRARRTVIETGAKIGSQGPAEQLHRLRIRCKRLRYLLEFFGELYEQQDVRPLVRSLKSLQDCLGEFNDLEVQQGALERFAERAEPESAAEIRPMIDELCRRQKIVRGQFLSRFAGLDSPENDQRFRRLFDGKPPGRDAG